MSETARTSGLTSPSVVEDLWSSVFSPVSYVSTPEGKNISSTEVAKGNTSLGAGHVVTAPSGPLAPETPSPFVVAIAEKKSEITTPDVKEVVPRSQVGGGKAGRKRKWCFTFFPKVEALLDDKKSIADAGPKFDKNLMEYLCFQLEQCPKTKKYHFQGFVVFHNAVMLATVQKSLDIGKSHCEQCHGTDAQNIAYCSKPDTGIPGSFTEFGQRPAGRGARTDILTIKKAIDDGITIFKLWEDYFPFMLRNHQSVMKYYFVKQPLRNWVTIGHVFYGPPGSGKTTEATEYANNLRENKDIPVYHQNGLEWSPGHDRAEVIIFDDFSFTDAKSRWCSEITFCKIFNKLPFQLNEKGSHTQLIAKHIVITTMDNPSHWPESMQRRCPMKFPRLTQFPECRKHIDEWAILGQQYEEYKRSRPTINAAAASAQMSEYLVETDQPEISTDKVDAMMDGYETTDISDVVNAVIKGETLKEEVEALMRKARAIWAKEGTL